MTYPYIGYFFLHSYESKIKSFFFDYKSLEFVYRFIEYRIFTVCLLLCIQTELVEKIPSLYNSRLIHGLYISLDLKVPYIYQRREYFLTGL